MHFEERNDGARARKIGRWLGQCAIKSRLISKRFLDFNCHTCITIQGTISLHELSLYVINPSTREDILYTSLASTDKDTPAL